MSHFFPFPSSVSGIVVFWTTGAVTQSLNWSRCWVLFSFPFFSLPGGSHARTLSCSKGQTSGSPPCVSPEQGPGWETSDGPVDSQTRDGVGAAGGGKSLRWGRLICESEGPLSPVDILGQDGNQRPPREVPGCRIAWLTRRLPARDPKGSPAPGTYGKLQSGR